jgi:glycosyltransferase involved in cell wall biosynthesis
VISTPLGGITDIVEQDRTGLLVPPNDAPALAAAITSLATDPARAERLALAGQEFARRNFSWDGVLAQWRALYAGVLESPASAAAAHPTVSAVGGAAR